MKRMAGLVVVCGLLAGGAAAQSRQFIYVSDQRIVTIEPADQRTVYLNYINLGDSWEILLAHQLVLVGPGGKVFRGHLFRLENPTDVARPYAVKELIRPGKFTGYQVVGKFDLGGPPERALFKVSGRILELEPLAPREFELAAARIGEVDLANPDRKSALERAGFFKGYGRLTMAGSEEAAAMEPWFEELPVFPPVALETPEPRLPSSESHLPDPVVVRVSAVVSRSGGLKNVQVAEGVGGKLDQIALQTVQNSWVFLPAISGTEVAEASVKLNVVFRR
jgi:hypothetical protein